MPVTTLFRILTVHFPLFKKMLHHTLLTALQKEKKPIIN